jgi:hypothetical protein
MITTLVIYCSNREHTEPLEYTVELGTVYVECCQECTFEHYRHGADIQSCYSEVQ